MSDNTGLRVVELRAENVKRLKAVRIQPSGDVVIVGGNNAQGKSSVLDSIYMALAGKSAACEEPIREGADAAEVVLNLGALNVRRKWKRGPDGGATSTDLTLTMGEEAAVLPRPQNRLDSLLGPAGLLFDPAQFATMDPKQRLTMTRTVMGIDTSSLDNQRREAYEERTAINRALRDAEGYLEGLPLHLDAPDTEASAADIAEKLKAAMETNQTYAQLQADVQKASDNLAQCVARMNALWDRYTEACNLADEAKKVLDDAGSAAASAVRHDTSALEQQLAGVEDLNRKVRDNARRTEAGNRVAALKAESDVLSSKIAEIDTQKADLVSSAKFPVAGLSFGEDDLLYNGIPIRQCSQAEAITLGFAMAIAASPSIRIVLIRDGSLLDKNAMAGIAALAAEHDVQVWIERVGDADECAIVIEDGEVAE